MSSWRAHGMRAWLLQRLTAVYITIFFLSLLSIFVFKPFDDYLSWREFIAQPLVNIATIFFFLAVLYHAWVGLRDVVIDYIPNFTLRMLALMLIMLFLFAMGVWACMILISVVVL